MPEYLSPGVYVEEVATGPRPIEGVSTSTAGFVGQTERGPVTSPRLVTSWGDYVRWYGGYLSPPETSYLPFGVKGFFDNGGQRAFIARITGAKPGTATISLATGATAVQVEAIGPGTWGENILIRVKNATQTGANPSYFRVTVLYYSSQIPTPFVDPTDPVEFSNQFRQEPDVIEDYDNVSATRGASNNFATVINAGSRLIRVLDADAGPARPLDVAFPTTGGLNLTATAEPTTALRIEALRSGATALTIAVADGTAANTFEIKIAGGGGPDEAHDNLTPATVLPTINGHSSLVRARWVPLTPPAPVVPIRPDNAAAAPLVGGAGALLHGATDVAPGPEHYRGDAPELEQRRGLAALKTIDEISLVCIPDEVNDHTGTITGHMLDHCELLKDRFAVLSIRRDQGDVGTLRPPRDSSYGAVYYPWIRVFDPGSQSDILIPPAGHVMGIYARTDVERGVHKAPANEVVRGIVTRDITAERKPLEFTVAKGEQDLLNPRGVNVIRDFRSDRRGIRVWGARTMSSDGQWKYVNVRRLFLFVEESIDEGTQWIVFEPNDENTWSAVRRSVTNFLISVWRSGALFGATQDEAFFVKCDRTTMTQDDIDNGRLVCVIGIAPVKPAEFVIFRISQKTAEAPA